MCYRLCTLLILLAVTPVVAQEESDRPGKSLPEYINKVKIVRAEGDEPVAPIARALFKYSDSARIIADGAIWAWSDGGRPLAMAKCWKNANGTQTCAFSLTSDTLIVAAGPQAKTWRPERTQIELVDLTGAPVPDTKDAVRLRQFKEQARRFAAHEFWNPENDRYELRLLPQPVAPGRQQRFDSARRVVSLDAGQGRDGRTWLRGVGGEVNVVEGH
jgi:hypothetical protein